MARIFPHSRKRNRLERMGDRQKQLDWAFKGTGKFVFRNHRKCSLMLPKPAVKEDGQKITEVPYNGTFVGDDYFMAMVKRNECVLVRTLEPTIRPDQPKTEATIMQEKLILDQPERVTTAGKTEQVVVGKTTKINEVVPASAPGSDVLMNEDPLDGVEIICG